jgi:hypothetical protein
MLFTWVDSFHSLRLLWWPDSYIHQENVGCHSIVCGCIDWCYDLFVFHHIYSYSLWYNWTIAVFIMLYDFLLYYVISFYVLWFIQFSSRADYHMLLTHNHYYTIELLLFSLCHMISLMGLHTSLPCLSSTVDV